MTEARALQLANHIAGLRADVLTRVGKTPPGGGVVIVTEMSKGVTVIYQENHAAMYYHRRRLGPVPVEERPNANRQGQ
jgi:hypothetical protein